MAEGFLKGVWGKPASQGTGVLGMWGTIKKTPTTIFKTITTPIGVMKVVIAGAVVAMLYVGYRKVK